MGHTAASKRCADLAPGTCDLGVSNGTCGKGGAQVVWIGRRVAWGPGAITTLEPTFAFKRAVYDA